MEPTDLEDEPLYEALSNRVQLEMTEALLIPRKKARREKFQRPDHVFDKPEDNILYLKIRTRLDGKIFYVNKGVCFLDFISFEKMI